MPYYPPPSSGSGIPETVVDAAGDLIVGDGADSVDRLPVGSDGFTLVADSVEPVGMRWTDLQHGNLGGITETDHHAAPAAGPDANITIDASGATGTSSTFARSGHGHQVVTTDAPSGANITIDAAASAAASGAVARAAHGHRLNTYSSAAAALGTPSAGTSTTAPSRGDHVHGIPVTAAFSKSGVLTTGTGAHRWYNDTGVTLTFVKARASVGTAPTGASILVDVHKGGTTIWATQSRRLTIAVSTNTDTETTFDTTTIADGDYLTVDIDQIGSTIAGSDLVVQLFMRAA